MIKKINCHVNASSFGYDTWIQITVQIDKNRSFQTFQAYNEIAVHESRVNV